MVNDVTEEKILDVTYSWTAHCDGGVDVVFPRVVKAGDGIYFTSYTEGYDTTTLHGYIKSVEEVVR